MKLALVSLELNSADPPLGLAYLASYLRKYGNFTNIVIIDKEDPIAALRREKPDLVGISAMTYEFPRAKKFAQEVKRTLGIPVILGGHHISLMPSHFDGSAFDVAVIGEGEQTLLELLNLFDRRGKFDAAELRKVKGVEFLNDHGGLELTERRPLLEPLDLAPFPARDLLKMKEYYVALRKATLKNFGVYTSMLTSRGCPFTCVFCSTRLFWQKARFHSARYVVDEMKELTEKYRLDGIIIFDDLFIANRARAEEIAKLLKEEGLRDKLRFHIYARANLINDETCKIMADMGVEATEFGLESGSDRVLNFLKAGNVTVADNRKALQLCKKYGFRTIGSLIIGSPGETEDDFRQTMSLVKDPNLDQAHVYQLTPYPGTKIWDIAKQQGIVSDDPGFDLEKIYLRKIKPEMLLTKEVSKEKFEEWYGLFQAEVAAKRQKSLSVGEFARGLKLKHLPYLFTPHFISKVTAHYGLTG
jgi:radical SAM superfamily enzyme YgiQ (UPF0313 family)